MHTLLYAYLQTNVDVERSLNLISTDRQKYLKILNIF